MALHTVSFVPACARRKDAFLAAALADELLESRADVHAGETGITLTFSSGGERGDLSIGIHRSAGATIRGTAVFPRPALRGRDLAL